MTFPTFFEEEVDEAQLIGRGRELASLLRPADCVTLHGDLGAGKSTLARAVVQDLTGIDDVPSPTFTLVQTYETERFTLWHYDLYRLESALELPELAIDEALMQGVCVIEWPEIALSQLPKDRLGIRLAPAASQQQRTLIMEGPQTWQQRWQQRTRQP